MRKVYSLVLALVMALSLFTGCSNAVGEIAGNVADAAMEELEKQVKATLEKNKVEVIEMKTAFGKLNDEGGKSQFFCAALIRSDATDIPRAAAETIGKLVTEAGLLEQSGSKVESDLLVHKEIVFKHSDFSGGNYYVIYAYHKDLTANMPTLGEE